MTNAAAPAAQSAAPSLEMLARTPSRPTADAGTPVFTYGKLTQLHPEVECYAKWWAELDLLYKGGHDLAKHIEDFLPRLVDESTTRHAERVKCAGYINYLAQVVDYFAGALFQEQLAVAPPLDDNDKSTPGEAAEKPEVYQAFERNADRKSTSFSQLLKSLVTTALVKRYTWLAIDLPSAPTTPPASLADEEASGQQRPYAYEVQPECVLDWCEDDDGCLEWAIVRRVFQERKQPESVRNTVVEEFTVWRRKGADPTEDAATGAREASDEKVVSWERYRISYKANEKPKDDDVAEFVDEGETSFKRIPLLRLEIKHGLWVGNLIGGLVKEHFQRRSALVSSGNRSLVAIPVVELGAQTGGFQEPIPADVAEDQSRGDDPVRQFRRRGYTVLATGDKLYFASPDPGAYDFSAKDLKDLKDEIFRVVRQMAASASNTPTVIGRSGKSKEMDRDSEAIILGNLGSVVRIFAVAVFTLVSQALDEHILWTAHGLETFHTKDRQQLLEEALQVDLIPIPSPTFKKTYKTDLALSLVENAQPETKEQIRQEIQAGVQAEEDMRAFASMPGDEQQQQDQAPPDGAQDSNGGTADASEAGENPPPAGSPATPKPPTPAKGLASAKAPKAPAAPKDPGGTGSALLAKQMAEQSAARASGPAGLQAAAAHVPTVATNAHLRASGASAPAFNPGVAETVHALLEDDYPEKAIDWLRDPKLVESIEGPRLVPTEQIDTSNRDEWNASDEDLSGYVDKIAEGKLKPIVLVNEPNDEKFMIVDGHHRMLAYEKLGKPAMAYIVHLKSVGDPRVEAMHASQKNENGEAKLTSQQKSS